MSHSPTEFPNERAESNELSEADRHRLLAADRRRAVLDVLSERTPPVELDELAAAIATREDDPSLSDHESERRVAISLHHNHLPMMADVGAIDYDPASTRVVSIRLVADPRAP